jgi:hypothetical protein
MLMAFAYTANAQTECTSHYIQANITALYTGCACSDPTVCATKYCTSNYNCYAAWTSFYTFASACQTAGSLGSMDVQPLNSTAWTNAVSSVGSTTCPSCVTGPTTYTDDWTAIATNCGGTATPSNVLDNVCYYNSRPATTLNCYSAIRQAAYYDECWGIGQFTGAQWQYVFDNYDAYYNRNCTGSCSAPSLLQAQYDAAAVATACSCTPSAGPTGCKAALCPSGTSGACAVALDNAGSSADNCGGLAPFSGQAWIDFLTWTMTGSYWDIASNCPAASTGSTVTCDATTAASAATTIQSSCGCTITSGSTAASCLAGLCDSNYDKANACWAAFDLYGSTSYDCATHGLFTDASWSTAFDYLGSTTGSYDAKYNSCSHPNSTGSHTNCVSA